DRVRKGGVRFLDDPAVGHRGGPGRRQKLAQFGQRHLSQGRFRQSDKSASGAYDQRQVVRFPSMRYDQVLVEKPLNICTQRAEKLGAGPRPIKPEVNGDYRGRAEPFERRKFILLQCAGKHPQECLWRDRAYKPIAFDAFAAGKIAGDDPSLIHHKAADFGPGPDAAAARFNESRGTGGVKIAESYASDPDACISSLAVTSQLQNLP